MLCHQKIACTFFAALLLLCLRPEVQAEMLGPNGIVAPTGINPTTGEEWKAGDTYHLLFVTSTTGPQATSDDINVYNQFVNTVAESAESAVAGYGVTWFVIGSTPTVHARDNAFISAPVYGLDGTMLATGYADMWDGSIAALIMYTEKGLIGGTGIASPYTGTKSDGTSIGAYALGGTGAKCNTGRTDYTDGKWINEWSGAGRADKRPYYALSEPLTMAGAIPEPGTLALLGMALLGLGWYAWRRRR